MKIKLHGLDELEKQLQEITEFVTPGSNKAAGKTLLGAARRAFKVVQRSAKSKAPEDTGLLKRRIKVQAVTPKRGDKGVVVGLKLSRNPKSLDKGGKPEARNWAWYEKGIPSRGIPAKPFFRPALDENATAVVNSLKEYLAKGIEELLKKAGGRK